MMVRGLKRRIQKILPKNKFARGVSILISGTAGAQLMLLLAAPLLTRLYSPEQFGLLAIYISILAMISVISSLRYELAIPLPDDDVAAANLLAASICLVSISAALTHIAVIVYGTPIAAALNAPQFSDYSWLLSVGVLVAGLYTAFNYWAVRKKSFSTIAKTKMLQSIATIAIQLLCFKAGFIALIVGQIAGHGAGTTTLARSALGSPSFKSISVSGAFKELKKYRQFPIFSSAGALLNTAGRQLPPVLIAGLWGAIPAGLYVLTIRVLQAPIALVTQSTAQVFLAHAVDANKEDGLSGMFSSAWKQSVAVFTLPLAYIAMISPHLFGVVFGDEWENAGVISAILCPWILMIAIANPLSAVVTILNRQGVLLAYEVVLTCLRLGGLLAGYLADSFYIAISLYSLGAVIGILAKLFWLAKIAGSDRVSLGYFFSREVVAGCILAGLGIIIHTYVGFTPFLIYVIGAGMLSAYRSVKAFVQGVSYA